MNQNSLSQKYLREALHYDPDTGIFTWKVATASCVKVGAEAGCVKNDGYRAIGMGGKSYKAHRLAWLYVHGEWPKEQIDHINHIRTDNRMENLRPASGGENAKTKG